MSKFQVIFIGIFVIFIMVGIALFATYQGRQAQNQLPAISIWGTIPNAVFGNFVNEVNANRSEALKINYSEISEANFYKTYVEALAKGQGPDVILIPQDALLKYEDKIVVIPNTVLTQRDFQNTFIQQGELYLTSSGTYALPFTIDPLVMYWNRDIFTNAGIATIPNFWDEFPNIGAKITLKDVNSNIRRSTVAMGEFSNVAHAREILGLLFLQAGNSITTSNGEGGTVSTLGNSNGFDGVKSAQAALSFFTKFADPRSPDYSWNRSLPNSKNAFLSGNLATYIGFASEISDLRQKNPNLNFDIAQIPQARGSQVRTSFGTMYGFSIAKSSLDQAGTFAVLKELLFADALAQFTTLTYLPPVRRDMIASGSTDPYLSIFYNSALISRGWLDGDRAESNRIFQNIVESVTSGRQNSQQALIDGSNEYDLSLRTN